MIAVLGESVLGGSDHDGCPLLRVDVFDGVTVEKAPFMVLSVICLSWRWTRSGAPGRHRLPVNRDGTLLTQHPDLIGPSSASMYPAAATVWHGATRHDFRTMRRLPLHILRSACAAFPGAARPSLMWPRGQLVAGVAR